MLTKKEAIPDYREFYLWVERRKYQRFVHSLFENGVYMSLTSIFIPCPSLLTQKKMLSLP